MKTRKASRSGAALRRKLDRAIAEWDEMDARGLDPRRAVNAFLNAVHVIARRPVENDDELYVLRRAVERMIADPPPEPYGSVEEAVLGVLGKAIGEAGSPLETAVFALARHQLAGRHIGATDV